MESVSKYQLFVPTGSSDQVLSLFNALSERLAAAPASPPPPLVVCGGNNADRDQVVTRLRRAEGEPDANALLQGACVVLQTSGSSSAQTSLVAITADALRGSAQATHQALGGPGQWVLALPAQHIAGLQVVTRAVVSGAPPISAVQPGGFKPEVLAEATPTTTRGRLYTALVSPQVAAILEAGGAALEALRRYDAVLLGGGFVAPSLLERGRAEGVNLVTTYGMTETSGGCVYDGYPLPGTDLLVDENQNLLIRTPGLMSGYLDEPTPWQQVNGLRYLRTSDRAEVAPDGRLKLLGRSDDLIKTGGKQVVARDVAEAATAAGVREAFVYGRPDTKWGQQVTMVAVPGPGTQAEDVRGAVKTALGAASAPRTIVFVSELPKTALGKVRRNASIAVAEEAIRQGHAWQR